MSSYLRLSSPRLRSVLAAALCSIATVSFAASPGGAGGPADRDASSSAAPASMFRVDNALSAPLGEFRYRTEGVSSSSSISDPVSEERASLSASGLDTGSQPPPGRHRRYGRSRYEDRMHNSDGSTKIAFMAGGGMSVPVGNTGKFYTPSYDFAVGVGRNFNRTFGVLGEFHYDHMGLTGGAIDAEYNSLVDLGATADDLAGFDANAHVLSLTVNPVVNFVTENSNLGAYVTGGVGYYHKATNFTLPTYGTYCSYFCYTYASNYNIDSASANAFGANFGFGLTYKISSFTNERLFVEARYHWLKINSDNNPDFFSYNRRNTSYIPVLVGLRF